MERTSGTKNDERRTLTPGTRIEVRTTLDGAWSRGFEVVDETADGYNVKRLSDGAVLPRPLPGENVRRERERGLWWWRP